MGGGRREKPKKKRKTEKPAKTILEAERTPANFETPSSETKSLPHELELEAIPSR